MKRLFAPVLLAIAVALAAAPMGCAKRAVAKVNGDIITEQEFFEALEAAQGRQVLDRLVLERIMAQKAKEKGITVGDEEVNGPLQELKERMREQWDEFLRTSGQTAEGIKDELRRRILLVKLMLPEQEVKEFYEQNRTRFDEPTQAKYRRVILDSKSEAQRVREQIVSGKLDFAQAVEEKSIDPIGKRRGGEIGPVAQGGGDPGVAGLLFTLDIGEISEPVESVYPKGSYQIIEVLERTQGKQSTYEESKSGVREVMMQQRQREVGEYLNDLRTEASVTFFRSRYESLAEEYAKLKREKPPEIEVPGAEPAAPAKPRPAAPEKPGEESAAPTPPE